MYQTVSSENIDSVEFKDGAMCVVSSPAIEKGAEVVGSLDTQSESLKKDDLVDVSLPSLFS